MRRATERAIAASAPPPLWLKVYDNTSGGMQVGFWMQHSTGWAWHGTGTGASRLGCQVTGYAWDTSVPSLEHLFSQSIKPVGNPYHVSISTNYVVQSMASAKATCTLRHLTVKRVWLYKTITASWNHT